MPAILTNDGITFSNATLTITDLVPPGTIITTAFYPSLYIPPGFLPCNGAAISRTTYATLFARIGTTWGIGDGGTTFNVPDLRGEFVRGWDDGRGVDSGRGFASFQDQDNVSHAHNFSDITATHFHGGNTGNVSNDHSHNYQSPFDNNTPMRPGPQAGNQNSFGANTGGINNNHFHGFGTGGISDNHQHGIGFNGGTFRPRNIALSAFIKF